MSKVLVAVDGSQGSEKALEAAVNLAQQGSCQLVAVAVLKRCAGSDVPSFGDEAELAGKGALEDALQAAWNYARSRGVILTPILREGHPADAIVSCAEEEKPDIVVVGSGGGTGRLAGLGGTADLVSSHAPCSVMIVR